MKPRIAIIIPYFQRRPGILRRALESVARQTFTDSIQLIIVDDGSPTPVADEVAFVPANLSKSLTVIQQPNQGAGAARNAGLDSVAESAEWVAFLDSDDIWRPQHLHCAASALSSGFDFFFADGTGEATDAGWFQAIGLDPTVHEPLTGMEGLFAFKGDFLDAVLRQPPCPTSTVVMRRRTLGALRFPATRGTWEDLQFWLKVAMCSPRVVFSKEIHVSAGEGEHVGSVADWRSNNALSKQLGYSRHFRWALEAASLTEPQKRYVNERLRAIRVDFATGALAMLKAGRAIDPGLLWSFVRENPSVLIAVLPVLGRRAFSALIRRPDAGRVVK